MKKQRGMRYTPEEKSAVLSKFKSSGEKLSPWCIQHGYNKGTIRNWLTKKKPVSPSSAVKAEAAGFATLNIEASCDEQDLRVHYPNGVEVSCKGSIDLALLKQLIYLNEYV
jgi:transposase-like protein